MNKDLTGPVLAVLILMGVAILCLAQIDRQQWRFIGALNDRVGILEQALDAAPSPVPALRSEETQ